MKFKQLLSLCLATFSLLTTKAKSHINIRGVKINQLDKQNRKQGNWIFFDQSGNALMSCFFQDDSCIRPKIFYEKGDTAFVRLQATDSVEPFILYKNNKHYFGSFIYTSDSVSTIKNRARLH